MSSMVGHNGIGPLGVRSSLRGILWMVNILPMYVGRHLPSGNVQDLC